MSLSKAEDMTDVHEKEMAYLRRSMEILKGENMRLHEKADHLESRLLFFVEQNEEKTHVIDELKMQLSDAQVRERELRKELDGIDKPFRKSSIFGRKFSRKNSMASMLSSSHDTVHDSGSMHVSQSSPFLLSPHGNGGGHLLPHHSVVSLHRGGEGGNSGTTLSSCDDVTSIVLSPRASPDLSSVDGGSSIASFQRTGSTSGGGSEVGVVFNGGESPHEVTTIEENDEERENQTEGGEKRRSENRNVPIQKEKAPKRKRSLWMRVTSGLPKIPGEFVV
ncbi:hypothetical protein PMAYCL1PPCAC_28500 [Pristionchus mayeri]|uniref:Uncharacterized protein n=1 Tax=Pristionchus mayeri TaxID=1317129 RepID=A0AAN5IBQ3_9BILA|nr:hypothetical protein PMAYCL1PPCAC_28500 [Pristionchus mayeri]